MINTTSIQDVIIERYAYLFCNLENTDINIRFGRFFEQENEDGELQYVFDIDNSVLTPFILKRILLPGIDLTQGHDIYVRNGELPCFVAYHRINTDRDPWNVKMFLDYVKLDYVDNFEYMLRSRCISHYTNCYLGRHPDDYYDFWRARRDHEFRRSTLPNLDSRPYNEFHKAERLFKEVNYDASID